MKKTIIRIRVARPIVTAAKAGRDLKRGADLASRILGAGKGGRRGGR